MPAVVRLGDLCTGHDACPPRPCVTASPNVFCNGIPVHRETDMWGVHGCDIHPPHPGILIKGSPNVFVNMLPIARIGDPVNCGSFAAEGSMDTFANGF